MIRVVKLSFHETHIDDFKHFFETRKERIKQSEGCQYLELWQDANEPSIFFTYSVWDDEDALNRYRSSDLFQDTWSTVKQWFNQKPDAFSATKLLVV